jgi:hypothetical protein
MKPTLAARLAFRARASKRESPGPGHSHHHPKPPAIRSTDSRAVANWLGEGARFVDLSEQDHHRPHRLRIAHGTVENVFACSGYLQTALIFSTVYIVSLKGSTFTLRALAI